MRYTFSYNLPSANSRWKLPHTMIDVEATLTESGNISIVFPSVHAGTSVEVLDWYEVVKEVASIARIEFDLRLSIMVTKEIIAA